jgi:HEAT repeat protein
MARRRTGFLLTLALAAVVPIVAARAQTTRPAADIPPDMPAEVKRHVEQLHSPDVYTRTKAIWALGRLKAKAAPAAPFLVEMLSDDAEYTPSVPDPGPSRQMLSPLHIVVHRDAAKALEEIGNPAMPALRKAAKEAQMPLRLRAARVLALMGDKSAIEIIAAAAADNRPAVRFEAASLLAELGDERAVEPLTAFLDDKDRRGPALMLLRRLNDPRANRRLLALLADPDAGESADGILLAIGGPGPAGLDLKPVLAALRSDWNFTRGATACALGRIGDPNAVGPLLSALKDKDGYVRGCVAAALGMIGDKRAVAPLIETMKSDAHEGARVYSAQALGRIADPAALDPLLAALKDKDSHVREVAAQSLGLLGDTRAIPELVGLLSDRYPGPQEAAANALIRIGRPAVAPLIAALSEGDAVARSWAPHALGKIGDRRAVGQLIEAAEKARRENAGWILTRTTRALKELTDMDFGEDAAKWRSWWDESRPVRDQPGEDQTLPPATRPAAVAWLRSARFAQFPARYASGDWEHEVHFLPAKNVVSNYELVIRHRGKTIPPGGWCDFVSTPWGPARSFNGRWIPEGTGLGGRHGMLGLTHDELIRAKDVTPGGSVIKPATQPAEADRLADCLRALDHTAREVRVDASRYLGLLGPGGSAGVARLTKMLDQLGPDCHDIVLACSLIEALGRIGPDARPALPQIHRFAGHRDPNIRAETVWAVARICGFGSEALRSSSKAGSSASSGLACRRQVPPSAGRLPATNPPTGYGLRATGYQFLTSPAGKAVAFEWCSALGQSPTAPRLPAATAPGRRGCSAFV